MELSGIGALFAHGCTVVAVLEDRDGIVENKRGHNKHSRSKSLQVFCCSLRVPRKYPIYVQYSCRARWTWCGWVGVGKRHIPLQNIHPYPWDRSSKDRCPRIVQRCNHQPSVRRRLERHQSRLVFFKHDGDDLAGLMRVSCMRVASYYRTSLLLLPPMVGLLNEDFGSYRARLFAQM